MTRSFSLELSTRIAAPPETVFRFFTDPERFSRWVDADVTIDPRPGGALRINFERFHTVVAGSVEIVEPPTRIVLAWGVEDGPQKETMPAGSTRVSITLERVDGGTRLTLRHTDLPSEKERRDHEEGWTHYLSQIQRVAGEEGIATIAHERGDE